MTRNTSRSKEADVPTLVREVCQDTELLIEQQMELLRSELHQALDRAREVVLSMGLGAGLAATGGILSTLMAVHALHRATGWPLWFCYGLIGGTLGGAGIALLREGQRKVAEVRLLPSQTMAALKENLTWLKEQAET